VLGLGVEGSHDEAISILRQMSAGLAAAHQAGIVHRDIRPGSAMLTSSGQVNVLDFGLARLWLARAHLANNDPEASRKAYEEFFALMSEADEGIPVIEEARAEYEAIPA
jgi:serine/threonine protein kinase